MRSKQVFPKTLQTLVKVTLLENLLDLFLTQCEVIIKHYGQLEKRIWIFLSWGKDVTAIRYCYEIQQMC